MQADYARQYRALWERHWWWRAREALVLDRIKALARARPIGRILDVGCGDGLFFEQLERFGAVEGLEPDATLVRDPRWARQIRREPLGPGFRADEPYDLILMLDVLEHIADDTSALRAARSALRPGGRLLLTVPALPWLWSRHDEANAHHRRYRKAELRDRVEAAGLTVESLGFFFAWTVAPLVARRWLAPAGAGVSAAGYAVAIPPAPINRVLDLFSRGEQVLGRFVRWPIGSSLLLVARAS